MGWRYARARLLYYNSKVFHAATRDAATDGRTSILDLAAIYALSNRINLTAGFPVSMNQFSLLIPPAGPENADRHRVRTFGVGDLTVLGRGWFWDTEKHPYQNFALGVGLQLPTGNFWAKSIYPDITGQNPQRKVAGPPGAMPGQGGLGIVYEMQGYKTFRSGPLKDGTAFVNGVYVSQPFNTNGAPSIYAGFGLQNEPAVQKALVNSVPDVYAVQAGLISPPLPGLRSELLRGMRPTFTYSFEGSRARDLFGRNGGYRQPGWTMAAAPGVIYQVGKTFYQISVPIVFAPMAYPFPNVPKGPFQGGSTVAPFGVIMRITRQL